MGINIDSLSQGMNKEKLLELIQKNYEANYNKQSAEKNISDLESDIASMTLKKNQADDILKIHKANYDNQNARYKQVYKVWSTLND